MNQVYTKTGDAGLTSLLSGERVAKCCERIECCGTADELQAALGMARALCTDDKVRATLHQVETSLVQAMAQLATVNGEPRISAQDVADIESEIDAYQALLPEGFSWCVPGDHAASAALHVARTVARRCERALLRCQDADDASACDELRAYMNRLSDLCYVCARYMDDVFYENPPKTCAADQTDKMDAPDKPLSPLSDENSPMPKRKPAQHDTMQDMYGLKTEVSFDAAHFLTGYDGKCENLHGHRWRVVVEIAVNELQPEGHHKDMVVDFRDFKAAVRALADELDHMFIVEEGSLAPDTIAALERETFRLYTVSFRTTSENLARFFCERLAEKGFPISRVECYETPMNCAIYIPPASM